MEYRAEMGAHDEEFRGLGLTSRKNLCLHPEVSWVFAASDKYDESPLLIICQVSKEKKGKLVDSKCRDLTSAFACEKGRAEPGSVPLCSFHEVSWIYHSRTRCLSPELQLIIAQELNNYETGNLIPPGVYTLDDVKRYGMEKGVCPYFTIRRMVRHSSNIYRHQRRVMKDEVMTNRADAIRRHHHLFFPLPPRSKSRRKRLGRAEQGEYNRL